MNAMDTKFATVRMAADEIGCTVGRVRQLIEEGKLEAIQPNGENTFWLLDKNSVRKYAKTPCETGRPRKKSEEHK